MQGQAEEVAALSLVWATLQTLQASLHWNLEQILDFKSLAEKANPE